jgi:adenylate cyclase
MASTTPDPERPTLPVAAGSDHGVPAPGVAPTPPDQGGLDTGAPAERNPEIDAVWRGILEGTDPRYRNWRGWLQRLPGARRCHMCAAPFRGPAAPVMRFLGRSPWHRNPNFCKSCFVLLEANGGGAEIECSMLFADVRGSTGIAERMSATEFRHLMDRFYRVSSTILFEQNGIIDKYVGDEVVAIFIPALANDAHASRAVAAATNLLRATGHGDPGGPWLPVGAGIATGIAYVGSVGSGEHLEFTALGDIVNTAARLASTAAAGEILLTIPALERANVAATGLEHRRLDLRGKTVEVDVAVLRPTA